MVFFAKTLLVTLVILLGFPILSPAKDPSFPRGDGILRLYNYHLDEWEEITFRKGGKIQPEGLEQINHLLRSRDSDKMTTIDIRLIDLLDHIQDDFKVDTIEVISGYRSSDLNQHLKEIGRQVSQESLHIKGRAIDFHIDEIKEETLREYLENLELGGVGYYGPLDFIHIDTGPYRTWGGSGQFARKLIGILDSAAPIQLTSDKNDYLPQDSLYFTWNFSHGYGPKNVETVRLEHFWRGKWVPCSAPKVPEKDSMLPISNLNCPVGNEESSFGKYRWIFKIKGQEGLLSSNEFYLKKK